MLKINQIPRTWLFAFLFLFAVSGCRENNGKAVSRDDDVWTVVKIDEPRGHDTIVNENGETYHQYQFAVVLENGSQKLSLIYQDRLPEQPALAVGSEFTISGIDPTEFKTGKEIFLGAVPLTPVNDRE